MDASMLELETPLPPHDPSWFCDGESRDWVEIYGTSPRKWSDKHFVLIRWLICVYWILAFFISVVASALKGYAWTIKLCFLQATYWVALLEVLYFVLAATVTTLARRVRFKGDAPGCRTQWLIYAALGLNRAVTATVIPVVVQFWIMVAIGMMKVQHPESWTTHGVNLLPIILDLIVARQSLPLKMVWIPLAIIVVYTVFGVVYCSVNKKHNLYGFNWFAKPDIAVALLGSFFVANALSYTVFSWFCRPRAGRDERSDDTPECPEFI